MTIKFPQNISNLDLQKMSKEELLSYIQLQNNKINSQANTISIQTKELNKKDEEITKQAEKLSYALTHEDVMQGFWDDLANMSRFVTNYTLDIGECRVKPFIEQLNAIKEDYIHWIKRAKAWLGKPPFTVGNESLSSVSEIEEKNKEIMEKASNAIRSLSNNKNLISCLIKSLGKAVEDTSSNEKELTNVQQALRNIAKSSKKVDNERKQAETLENLSSNVKGKQKPDNQPSLKKLNQKPEDNTKCEKCNNDKLVNVDKIVATTQKLLVDLNQIRDNLESTEIKPTIWFCEKCGHYHLSRTDNLNISHPVVPDHKMDALTIFRATECQYRGIPIYKFREGLCSKYHIGNDTIEREIRNFVQIYLKPLYAEIKKAMNSCSVILCDGTPFNALENQGKGSVVAAKEKAGQSQEGTNVCSSNYVLAVTTGPAEKLQAVNYHYIKNRTIENVASALVHYKGIECLCTDAYSGYDSVASQLNDKKGCKLQKCWVHARRELFKAVLPDNVAKEFNNLTQSEQTKYLKERMLSSSKTDFFIMGLSIIDAISQIYYYESKIDYKNQSPSGQNKILSIRKLQKELISNIDILVTEMSKGNTKTTKTGKYQTTESSNPYIKFCVYYLNNKEDLWYFTESTVVPPDTNAVERSIRPLTILRKNIFHKNAEWGMECMTTIYSVYKTLEMNGYDIEDFMKKYTNDLYCYCVENGLYNANKDGVDVQNKKIKNWDMVELSNGFDFSKYNPLNLD